MCFFSGALKRESQKLVPSRNFSHLVPQFLFPQTTKNLQSAKFSCYMVSLDYTLHVNLAKTSTTVQCKTKCYLVLCHILRVLFTKYGKMAQ